MKPIILCLVSLANWKFPTTNICIIITTLGICISQSLISGIILVLLIIMTRRQLQILYPTNSNTLSWNKMFNHIIQSYLWNILVLTTGFTTCTNNWIRNLLDENLKSLNQNYHTWMILYILWKRDISNLTIFIILNHEFCVHFDQSLVFTNWIKL